MPPEQVQQQQDQQGLPQVVDDNAPPPAVEVEIKPEDMGNAPVTVDPNAAQQHGADGQQQEPERKPNRVPADKRIAQLTREKHAERSAREAIQAELEEARRIAAAAVQQKQIADMGAFAHYKAANSANIILAQAELRDAIAAGDPDKQAQASAKLAQYAADKSQIDAFEAAQPRQQDQPQQQQQARQEPQQRQQQVQESDEIRAFKEANPWFDPSNAEFDQEMADEAISYARYLESKYERQGKPLDQAYWDGVVEHIDKTFGGERQQQQQQAPTKPIMKRALSDVAPVNRSAGGAIGNGGPSRPGNKVTLSPEMRQIAHALADNGALSFPVGHPKFGQRPTHAEGEYLYAAQMVKRS